MKHNTKEELLREYRTNRNPGFFPFVFACPFTIAGIVFTVFTFLEAAGGLFLGALMFYFVAYIFGWGIIINYIKTISIIKREKYATVRAKCTSNVLGQECRYLDDPEKTPIASITFQNETKKYSLKDRGTFYHIKLDTEYLLIFFKDDNAINAIIDESTDKIMYLK